MVEIIITLAVLVAAVVLFATERLPVDLVALMVMGTLLLTQIVSPEEGLSGFSNTATVTVAAMFVLSAGLFRTGAVNFVGEMLGRIGRRSSWLMLVTIMVGIGAMSAFINNTAVVAIFLPIVLRVARDTKVSPSKLLMPLSFSSMFGGVCTLIGTSTNILVSSIAERHDQPAFGMFEFLRLGLVMFGAGIVYMAIVGYRLIPDRRGVGDLTQTFGMGDYLTQIVLLPEGKSVGKTLKDSPLVRDLDIRVLEVRRNEKPLPFPTPDTVLEAGDELVVRCSVEKIKKLRESVGVALKPGLKWRDQDLESPETALVEAVIAPRSSLDGSSLERRNFRKHFGGVVLAVRHRGQLLHENLASLSLQAGDALLIEIPRERLEQIKMSPAFVLVSELGLPEFRKTKLLPAILIVAGVVTAAAFNLVPIVLSAVLGCVLLVLTRCIRLDEAYKAIDWSVIFLLAGVLTLGVALEKTGTALIISSLLVKSVGVMGPVATLSAFYFLTAMLTGAMSNNATAVLLAPIAIAASESLGVNARPFLIAVSFAASSSFMTPVGYQTNTLVYGAGQYRFSDFMRVGGPLTLLFWVLATIFIPRFWPL